MVTSRDFGTGSFFVAALLIVLFGVLSPVRLGEHGTEWMLLIFGMGGFLTSLGIIWFARAWRRPNSWYLISVFLGIIGGSIAYLRTKDHDKETADDLLICGIFSTLGYIFIFILVGVLLYRATHLQ